MAAATDTENRAPENAALGQGCQWTHLGWLVMRTGMPEAMMMEIFAAEITDKISAWASVTGAGATVVAACAAVVAAVVAIRTLHGTRRDSRDRSRPMIGARLERDPHPTSKVADLVIRNYGQSVAYNVRVQFEPELKDTGTTSGEDSFMPLLLRRYETPISNLMPGVELRSLWFMPGQTRDGIIVNDEPIPDLVTATISYSDRPQVAGKDTNRYSESFQLDVEILRGDVLSTSTDDHLGLHKRSVKAIEAMNPDIKVIARSMSKMEDYAKPDSVRVREGVQAEEHRRRAEARQRSRDEAIRERSESDGISNT